MTETAEELLKYTRRELEGMAEKLGIETLGIGTKTRLAETIIKAKEKAGAKKIPKPKVEAPVKMQTKPRIGKKGVLAKRAAIDAQIRENEEAVAKIETGVKELQNVMDNKAKELQKGVRGMHKGIGAQIKENEEAVAKIETGVKELQNAMDNKAKEMLQEGIKELQKGVREMHKGIGAQIKENEEAVAKIEAEIRAFQDETANYIKDFYYG